MLIYGTDWPAQTVYQHPGWTGRDLSLLYFPSWIFSSTSFLSSRSAGSWFWEWSACSSRQMSASMGKWSEPTASSFWSLDKPKCLELPGFADALTHHQQFGIAFIRISAGAGRLRMQAMEVESLLF